MFVGIKMPKLSETIDEYRITKIFKKAGDMAVKGEPMMDVESDKGSMTVCFYNTGKITEFTVREGDTVKYNSLIGVIDE